MANECHLKMKILLERSQISPIQRPVKLFFLKHVLVICLLEAAMLISRRTVLAVGSVVPVDTWPRCLCQVQVKEDRFSAFGHNMPSASTL